MFQRTLLGLWILTLGSTVGAAEWSRFGCLGQGYALSLDVNLASRAKIRLTENGRKGAWLDVNYRLLDDGYQLDRSAPAPGIFFYKTLDMTSGSPIYTLFYNARVIPMTCKPAKATKTKKPKKRRSV